MKFPIMQLGKVILTGLVLVTLAPAAKSQNLVTNGGFGINGGSGELGYNTTAAGWTTTGYNFLYTSANSAMAGANGQYGPVALWGPGNGQNNGFMASPDGGAFVAADGNFDALPISQTVNGLTVGGNYVLSFYWAGAQQAGFGGAASDSWQVSLGAQTLNTPVANNASQGFTGWMPQTMDFTASSSSETLSFLAMGRPGGQPPFLLLDGVSLTSAPDTASTALLGSVSVLALLAAARLRGKRA